MVNKGYEPNERWHQRNYLWKSKVQLAQSQVNRVSLHIQSIAAIFNISGCSNPLLDIILNCRGLGVKSTSDFLVNFFNSLGIRCFLKIFKYLPLSKIVKVVYIINWKERVWFFTNIYLKNNLRIFRIKKKLKKGRIFPKRKITPGTVWPIFIIFSAGWKYVQNGFSSFRKPRLLGTFMNNNYLNILNIKLKIWKKSSSYLLDRWMNTVHGQKFLTHFWN